MQDKTPQWGYNIATLSSKQEENIHTDRHFGRSVERACHYYPHWQVAAAAETNQDRKTKLDSSGQNCFEKTEEKGKRVTCLGKLAKNKSNASQSMLDECNPVNYAVRRPASNSSERSGFYGILIMTWLGIAFLV